jgi:hypothetical protein
MSRPLVPAIGAPRRVRAWPERPLDAWAMIAR